MSSIDPSSAGNRPNLPKPQAPEPGKSFSDHMQGVSGSDIKTNSEGEQAFKDMFPQLHFNKKQYNEFLQNMVRQLSAQMKRDMAQMKKAARRMKRAIEGRGI